MLEGFQWLALCFWIGFHGVIASFLRFVYIAWDGVCPGQGGLEEAKHLIKAIERYRMAQMQKAVLCIFF